MRYVAVLLFLLMICASLSGCLGNDVETNEGDPVVLGESTDDWPTYYVATANDLPTCDSTTLGRLYYVEADTNFQACMSTGWQVVQLGGTGGNLVINQPPIIEANVWFADDDLVQEDGDGTYSILMGLHWNSTDTDGTISQIGIDYDGDLTIDIPLSTNSGSYSGGDNTFQGGEVISGLFAIPFESGLTFHRGQTPTNCIWSLTRTITVMAVDDDGATSLDYITRSAIDPRVDYMGMLYMNAYDAMDLNSDLAGFISQADYDWILGAGTSTCPAPPVFSLTFDSGAVTSGDSDVLGVLTLVSGSPTTLQGGDCTPIDVGLSLDGQNHGQGCSTFGIQFSGTDSANPTAGDTWTISEAGVDVCNPTNLCDGIYVDLRHDVGSDSENRRINSA